MNERTLERARKILADPVRLHAYQAALEQVCAGRVVCEIGVGLGALSLLALRLGAARVYGVDSDSDTLQFAAQVISQNGFGADRFIAVRGRSLRVDLPERVDVLIADVLEDAARGRNVFTELADARRRFAAPDAAFIPSQVELRVALARPDVFRDECEFWDADLFCRFEMDFGAVVPALRERTHTLEVEPDEIVSEWQTLRTIESAHPDSERARDLVALEVRKPGRIEGACIAYDAALVDGVRIGNLPADSATGPAQGFQPFPRPLLCGEGDLVAIRIDNDARELDFAAAAEVVPAPSAAEFLARLEDRRGRSAALSFDP